MQNKINLRVIYTLITWFSQVCASPVGNVVSTQFGNIEGLDETACLSFRGIQYAEIPARWQEAVPITAFSTNPLDATSWGPMCWQSPCFAPAGVCGETRSEDCLFLNIFVPKNTDTTSGLAVMIFLHGGGFEVYTASANIYHACHFVEKGGVIVVTLNYRLGILHGMYTGDTASDAKGNYALTDQRQAINWVYDNIAEFGGNKDEITLFGQSAGAQSIYCHLMAKKIDNKIKRIIAHSAPIAIPFRSREEALTQGDLVASAAGCAPRDLQCLRSKSADEIVQASHSVPASDFTDSLVIGFEKYVPVIDGDEVLMHLYEFMKNPESLSKPAILGTVDEEAILYVYYGFGAIRVEIYKLLLISLKGFATFLKVYPMYVSKNWTDARPELSELVTDFLFVCPTRLLASIGASISSDIWLYNFNQAITVPGVWESEWFCEGKVCHGIDVPFLFQTFELEGISITDEEKTMSDSIIQYWTTFAKTGNPNQIPDTALLHWPKYNRLFSNKHMTFQIPSNKVISKFKNIQCNIWDYIDSYFA